LPSYPGLVPFIVHGHDHAFRDSVVDHLQRTLGMAAPVVLDLVASGNRTVIEKFEEESAKCNLAVVLLTPDDRATTGTGTPYNTARPNVWIELGYFLGLFGRRSAHSANLQEGPRHPGRSRWLGLHRRH
jgi:predicted nucleotide-binding protein